MISLCGLFDHMVLQRNSDNLSDASFRGECESEGVVKARVLRDGAVVAGFDGIAVGQAGDGEYQGRLAGMPVGGPYRVELWVDGSDERLAVDDVLVGDVWILGGQSNMQGCGAIEGAEQPDAMVRAFYMHDQWGVAQDPIHNICDAVDQVHADLCGGMLPGRSYDRGVGPGVAFGKAMYEFTGVPQGVIACAHGGTSMSQWDPKLKRRKGRSLYGATLRRFTKNGGKVAGVVWYQGCSDTSPDTAPLYTKRMKALVAAMRKDLGVADLPFAAVQIGRVCGVQEYNPYWNSVQDQERRLPDVIPHCAVVPAIDLPLDDGIHLSGAGHNVLGKRLAQAMCELKGIGEIHPITLKSVKMKRSNFTGCADIYMEFDNVVGGLQSQGLPSGFDFVDGGEHDYILRIDLEGNTAILRTVLTTADAPGKQLFYGYGASPYCNITDAVGQALPVFGPIQIGKPRAVTDFIRTLRISELHPSAGKLHALAYPQQLATLGLHTQSFPIWFCEIHSKLAAQAPKDVLVYYACRFTCSEPMRLAAMMGYDGPLKVWLDGQEVFFDPKGINPADPNDAYFRFPADAGAHEMLVALGSNHGNAYGISLRLERLDISRTLLKKGPEAYAMPVIEG